MPLQIIRNDIIKVKADAIVNTANPDPVFDVYKVDSILLENGCDGIKKLK